MKNKIKQEIQTFVAQHIVSQETTTEWEPPLVGFAASDDPLFEKLKTVVSPTHMLPGDLLAHARTVIAFFLPFPKEVSRSNSKNQLSSRQWANSYLETNELIRQLNNHLETFFKERGEKLTKIPPTNNWIQGKLISNWSHRHVAYVAGLGSFGLNNMLITEKGCCGRMGSVITSEVLEPDRRPEQEACLFKFDGNCQKCIKSCVNQALLENSFDRLKCYEQLQKNVEPHKELGYADVCGKCLTIVPCSHTNPVKMKQSRKK